MYMRTTHGIVRPDIFLTVLVSFSVFDRLIVLTSVELSGTIIPQI